MVVCLRALLSMRGYIFFACVIILQPTVADKFMSPPQLNKVNQ